MDKDEYKEKVLKQLETLNTIRVLQIGIYVELLGIMVLLIFK